MGNKKKAKQDNGKAKNRDEFLLRSPSPSPVRKSSRLAHKTEASTHQSQVKINDTAVNVSVANKYEILTGNSAEIRVQKNESKTKIPPITLFDVTIEHVYTFMENLNIKNFNARPLKHGIQLLCKSIEDFTETLSELDTLNVKHYSHELPSKLMFKVVLLGLIKVDTDKLKEELKHYDIIPEEVKMIIPKNARYQNHCNYLLYFKKGSITLPKLRETKALFNLIINWQPYRNNRQGPIQCKRCCRPGHGQRYCKMNPRCEFCAEEHMSQDCPKFDEIKRQVEKAKISNASSEKISVKIPGRCCNCNVDGHFAFDPECPKKKQYQQKRMNLSLRGKSTRKPVPDINNIENFPAPFRCAALPQPVSVPRVSYSNTVKQALSKKSPEPVFLDSSDGNLRRNESSFSYSEVLSLTSDILTQLGNLKSASRQEVFMKVMQLSVKYLFHDDGSK